MNIGWNHTNSLNDIEVFERVWNFETDIWWIFICDQKRLSKKLKRISMHRELFSRSDRKEVIVWCHKPTLLILHIDFGTYLLQYILDEIWRHLNAELETCDITWPRRIIRINNECSIIDYHAPDFIPIFQLQMMVSRGVYHNMIQSNLEI